MLLLNAACTCFPAALAAAGAHLTPAAAAAAASPQEVYGSATKSNNNSWLRRKLYEAVGVAPLKASTKGKARKAASSSASRKSGGHGPKDGKARPAKAAAAPKARRPSELPASPQGGMSIFDYSDMLSGGTTASDSEDGCGSHGTFPASLHTSAPGTPRSSLGLPFAAGALFGGQPREQLPSLAPPAGFVPLPGMPPSEPQSPQASGLHWADGFSPAQQPPAAAPFVSAASRTLSMEAGADELSGLPGSSFKPMDLEQVGDALLMLHRGSTRAAVFGGMQQPSFSCCLEEHSCWLLLSTLAAYGAACSCTTCLPAHAPHGSCLPWLACSRTPPLPPALVLPQDASWDAADVSGQPWYFGGSLDLSVLGPAALPMECGSSAACEEDDDIPLLTLDLGGERCSRLWVGRRCTGQNAQLPTAVAALQWPL